jgi:transcription initiation factor IIE alpha subunit
MKVMKDTYKGQEVYICTGCATVVENLNDTTYFPQGYHYDTCPKCNQDLDYKEPKVIERTVFTKSDLEVIAQWAQQRKSK